MFGPRGGALMRTLATMALVGGLAVVGANSAHAQGDQRPTVARGFGTDHLRTPMGTSFQLGGGVTNFASQRTRDLTSPGGYWDARAVVGTRTALGLELAYVGNASP